MKHGSLFSGLGGFDLAAEWMGWENIFHCEWMEFPRNVLDYHFPNADSLIDICKTDFKKYANEIDILTGGFPCQPFSVAGKRKGANDERYLWHEMLRAIQEIKPTFVIAENVANIFNIDDGLVFEQVCLDLEAEGYEVQPFNIPAASKNAPHRRARIWFVATNTKYLRLEYSTKRGNIQKSTTTPQKERNNATKSIEADGIDGNVTDSNRKRCERQRKCGIIRKERENRNKRFGQLGNIEYQWQKFPTQPPICGGDDGLPTELDGITFSKWRRESIKGYGNAIVPQVAFEIFKQLEKLYLEL